MSILPTNNPGYLTGLSSSESDLIDFMSEQLMGFAVPNMEAEAYYEARHELEFPGVTIPQNVADRIAPVTGTPATVVDVLDERLDFLGWDDSELSADFGLDEVYERNELDAEAPMAHLDALIFGTSFVRVGSSANGPLVTIHSPKSTTGIRDATTRRLNVAWSSLEVENGETIRGVLDLPNESIVVARNRDRWVVEDRDRHNLGRVPVVQLSNRPRASRPGGRSEITPAIRSLTENMMRATLGMNVNTMFYSIPQLMILGRGQDAFKDRDGNPVPGWKILAGHALAISNDQNGNRPDVKQVQVASPQPFIEQLRDFRMQVASEAGMPADYLGIQTSNPSSADAIRMGESRMVKRTERRQSGFGRSWLEVARLAVLIRDGAIPEDFDSRVFVDWQPASTPTRAATADEIVKYVSAGVLDPKSAVVRKRMNLTRSEMRLLEIEQERGERRRTLEQIISAGRSLQGQEDSPELVDNDDDSDQ